MEKEHIYPGGWRSIDMKLPAYEIVHMSLSPHHVSY